VGLALCFLAFVCGWAFTRRRLGHGLGFVLATGCIYGWLRANLLDGFTHFCFDAALAGLYTNALPRIRFPARGPIRRLGVWTLLLVGWPFIVILLSPFLDAQHVYVQFVGLRTAILFAPLLLIGDVATDEDFRLFRSWAGWCVIGASGFTLGEVVMGLESFFPLNEVTEILYSSADVAGGHYRLPSSFTSAHAYGGTMVGLLPVLLGNIDVKGGNRLATLVATALASLGVFACGARLPVVLFAVVMFAMVLRLRRKPIALALVIVTMCALGYAVSQSDRLRRFESLGDTEMVEGRVSGSVTMDFWEIVGSYPMGKGLGSAFGTSVPFFLAEYARPPIGIESEFGRLLLEEGVPGLLLWVSFVAWLLGSSAHELRFGSAEKAGMWAVIASSWASGLLGAGVLSSIPGTFLLMIYMGALARTSEQVARRPHPGWHPIPS
jgi:hypothetical protein